MKKILIVILSAILTLVSVAQEKPGGQSSITIEELKAIIEYLSSPELEGREAGQPGSEKTAEYIIGKYTEIGLQYPPGMDSYRQDVKMISMMPDFENTVLSITEKKKKTAFVTDKDVFYYPGGGDDADISAPVVFCGYGITAPEYKYDDYEGIDTKGKIVVIFYGEPQEKDSTSVFNGNRMTKYSMNPVKVRIASQHGASALLVINTPSEDNPPIEEKIARYRNKAKKPIIQLPDEMSDLPVIYLKKNVADDLFGGQNKLAKAYKKIDEKLEPASFELKDVNISINIRFKDKREFVNPNIVGYLPGSNSDMNQEHLIIGAHYDHEGMNDGVLYPGADDNASGVAGLLELADAFANNPEKPLRSIIFISFAAEEKGTLGSKYYTKNPILPLDQAVSMLNMDEIGRNGASTYRGMHDPDLEEKGVNYLMVAYSAQTPLLEEYNDNANTEIKLELDFDPNVRFYGSSDHANFHPHDIPCIFYFTGFHSDYTSPSDTPDKINYPKLQRIVKLIYCVSEQIADADKRPIFDKSITDVKKKKRMEF